MNALGPPGGDEPLIELIRVIRFGGADIGGAAAAAGIAVKGELGDGEDAAARVQEGSVHDAVFIVEDPEVGDLLRHVFQVVFRIFRGNADEDHEAGADGADGLAVHGDGGGSDTLDYAAHGWFIPFFVIACRGKDPSLCSG